MKIFNLIIGATILATSSLLASDIYDNRDEDLLCQVCAQTALCHDLPIANKIVLTCTSKSLNAASQPFLVSEKERQKEQMYFNPNSKLNKEAQFEVYSKLFQDAEESFPVLAAQISRWIETGDQQSSNEWNFSINNISCEITFKGYAQIFDTSRPSTGEPKFYKMSDLPDHSEIKKGNVRLLGDQEFKFYANRCNTPSAQYYADLKTNTTSLKAIVTISIKFPCEEIYKQKRGY